MTKLLALTSLLTLAVAAVLRAQAPVAPGRLVDVGGWTMHIRCLGPKAPGVPTVILEAGAGDSSIEWSLVQPEIARFAHVCAYDRSGSGWSELGPYPHTAAQIALEFDTLLQRAGEAPPFVLVGHSMGGRYVRVYALAHPGNVTGMVLVDANSEDDLLFINGDVKREPETATGQTVPVPKAGPPLRMEDIPAEALAQIRRAAADAAAQPLGLPYTKLPPDAQAARLWALAQPKHYAANNSPFNGDEAAALLARRRASAQLLGDMPLVVVTRDEAITQGPRAAERETERQQHQAGLTALSSRGKQVVAPRSGHHVQIDAPAVVVDAIREVVSASQKH